LGFGVWGMGFWVWGLGFGVWGWGFGVCEGHVCFFQRADELRSHAEFTIGIHRIYYRNTPNLLQDYTEFTTGMHRIYYMNTLNLLQEYPKFTIGIPQIYYRTPPLRNRLSRKIWGIPVVNLVCSSSAFGVCSQNPFSGEGSGPRALGRGGFRT
jgi:hypothetical protein